ncbi:MAG: hypothetical protein ABFS35_13850 [Bacteroidota bacterium]
MNKPEFYPYVLLPEEIEKLKIEGIPVPEIKELPAFPEKPKKKFLGTIILLLSIAVIVTFGWKIIKVDYPYDNIIIAFALFVGIVSLTATVFEILHNGKTKKQYKIAIKLFNELKKEQEELKEKRSRAIEDNNSASAIEAYRHDAINKYFRYSYNKIQAVQKEHTVAQNRFVVFLEQYFEGKLLENIRIVHKPKELDYSPDFVIKLDSPKVNIAVDVEEPYLFDGTKIVVKKNRAEELFKIRYRVTNELRWVSIVFSEEQIVTHPTEACKLIAHTIDEILLKEKYSGSFKDVEKLKRVEIPGQRELSAFIRNKYREKYLASAGLIDGLEFDPSQFEFPKKEENLSEKEKKVLEKKEIIDVKSDKITEKEVEKKTVIEQKDEKKLEPEVEQLQIVKKVTDQLKSEKLGKEKKDSIVKELPKKEEKEKLEKIDVTKFKKDKLPEKKVEKETVIDKEDVKKQEHEVEQSQIIKRVTEKLKSKKLGSGIKDLAEKKQLKEEEKLEKTDDTKLRKEKIITSVSKGQLRKEADILNKLYSIKDTKKEKIIPETEKEESLEKELHEKVQVEKGQLEKEKVDKEFLEKERLAKEKFEKEHLEKIQLEKQSLEKVKVDQERPEKEQVDKERLEQERKEKERLEKERLAKEHQEKVRLEKELLEKERTEKEQKEKERLAKEKLVKEQQEKEQVEKERLEKEKAEKEQKEKERLAKEKQVKEQQEKERLEKEKVEKDRLEKEKLEKIRLEKERINIEKLQKELDKKAEIESNNKLMEQHKKQIEILVSNQEWDKLFNKCNEVIEEFPYWDWPYYRISTVHGNQGKFDEVLEDCNKALALNPKLPDAYYNRATANFFLEKYQEAVDDYQKSIDLKYQNSVDAYFNKGLCYQNMDHQKKAYREFLKAKNLGSKKAVDVINQQYSTE